MNTFILLLVLTLSTRLQAGEADVVNVVVKHSFDDVYNFDVTVKHDDEGWKHYANGWEIVLPEGKILAVRVLRHPHTTEQPFTRSMPVKIPQEITEVLVRAHDSVHEYGGCEIKVKLPVPSPDSSE